MLQSNQSCLCGLDRGRDQIASSLAYKEQLTEEGREVGRSSIKREKSAGPRKILVEHHDGLERSDFCDFDKPRKPRKPIRKDRLSPTSKARREAIQNEFVEKCGVPDRVESFEEIDSSENRPRALPGFVKPIQNGLRKAQNLIQSKLSKAETGLAGRENAV